MSGSPTARDEGRRRIMELVDVLTVSLSETDARAHAVKHFGVSPRTARRYVKAALRFVNIEAQSKRLAQQKRALILRRLARLAEVAEADRQHSAAVSAIALLAKIEGMLPELAPRGLLAERTTTVVTDRGALVARQVERLSMLGDEQLDAVERALLRVTVDAPAESSPVALPPGPGPGQGQGQ